MLVKILMMVVAIMLSSMCTTSVFVRALLLGFLLLPCYADASEKIIMTGWDTPTPSQWRAQLLEVEKKAFFSGYVIKPTRVIGSKEVISSYVFSEEVWYWDDFKPALTDLLAVKSSLVKDNFLLVSANPGNVDFFDDIAWGNVVNHWRFLARLAKLGGMKGLVVDTEPYVPPFRQFSFVQQKNNTIYSFMDYKKKARQRGYEVLTAVLSEYPDAVIFWYRLMSQFMRLSSMKTNYVTALHSNNYGLFPDFANGMFDAANSRVLFVEGNEESYTLNSRDDFESAYTALKMNGSNLLDEKHRLLWQSQVKIGHGIYMDAYFNDHNSKWFVDSKGVTVGERMVMNMAAALNASDNWIWVYGEKGYWWKNAKNKNLSWLAKNGNIEYLKKIFVDEKKISNNKIISFKKINTFKSWTSSSYFSNGVESKCLYQERNIFGDELFSIQMFIDKQFSNGFFSMVQWKSEEQLYPYSDTVYPAERHGQLRKYYALVRAPKSAKFMRLSLCSDKVGSAKNFPVYNLVVSRLRLK